MYRLLAIDLDETLLSPRKLITQRTYHTLMQAVDYGMQRVIATGQTLNVLRVVCPAVSKGNALKFLAQELNIAPEEIVAFGDDHNVIGIKRCYSVPYMNTGSVQPTISFERSHDKFRAHFFSTA